MLVIREAQTVDDLMARIDLVDAQSAMRALTILEELHTRVLAQIAAQPTITASVLPHLRDQIERLMRQYSDQIARDFATGQETLSDLTDDVVHVQVRAAGLNIGLVGISDTVLKIAQAHSASEIRGVTSEQLRKIDRELHQAVLGGRTFPELVKKIGANLDDASVFGTLRTRVEMIVRTESANIFNWSMQARGNQVAEQLPGTRKTWRHRSGIIPPALRVAGKRSHQYTPRPAHLALDGHTIPWGETFMVNGYEAHGPHDASLPASEVIACGCRLTLDFSQVENPLYRINTIGAPADGA